MEKRIFRLTFGVSILLGVLAGAKAEYSHELGWAAFLAPFVVYIFDLKLSSRFSGFDADIFWSFFVVYVGFIWLIYFIGNWSARGFSSQKRIPLIKKFFNAILTNPTDRMKDGNPQN